MTYTPRILAIDDSPANLKTLVAALNDEYELQIALSGTEGLAFATAAPPDLILLDIMMPELDGYEVCRRLKADSRTKDVPVMFITATSEAEAEYSGLALGAVDYLAKPINVPIARQRIRNQIERELLRKEIAGHRDLLEEQVRERTLSLSIAKEAAETANRLKATVLANISHEFRSPIHAVLGMVGMARRRTDDARVRDCLVKAEEAANQLLATLTGLLDLALTESKRLTLERVRFRPSEVIAAAIRQAEPALKSKSLRLTNQNPGDTEWVIGDPMRIQQVVQELISNAIKFSATGTIAIESTFETHDTGSVWLCCKVRDEGIGIAPEHHHEIFQPFRQLDGSSTRQFGGNGIGLALCRQLVSHMGGAIAVDSTPGHGATFAFRIPVERAAKPESGNGTDQDAASQLSTRHGGARILVAEDDQVIQALIRSVLEPAGLSVVLAADGAEAVEIARSERFALIVMDLIMPRLSGIEAAQAIRALPQYRTVPILATTARAFERDRDECLRAGIDAHIAKPFAPELLLNAVLAWLDRN